MMVLTATRHVYRRDDGVLVVLIGVEGLWFLCHAFAPEYLSFKYLT